MDSATIAALRANVLWFGTRRHSVEGRACRDYDIMTEAGDVLLRARSFLWGRELSIATPDGRGVLSVLRSRAFPLTGTAAVRELSPDRTIGTVHRNGAFRDPAGTVHGRFRDARTMRERVKENAFQVILDTILTEGETSMPAGPDALVMMVDDAIAATLSYGRLPFDDAAATEPQTRVQKMVPGRLRDAWQSLKAPHGWKFSRMREVDCDPRLELAAALFAAELSRW